MAKFLQLKVESKSGDLIKITHSNENIEIKFFEISSRESVEPEGASRILNLTKNEVNDFKIALVQSLESDGLNEAPVKNSKKNNILKFKNNEKDLVEVYFRKDLKKTHLRITKNKESFSLVVSFDEVEIAEIIESIEILQFSFSK